MIKLCKDCKYSKVDDSSSWQLRCYHTEVNRLNPYALGRATFTGTECAEARKALSWFKGCDMKGKLWEQKSELEQNPKI